MNKVGSITAHDIRDFNRTAVVEYIRKHKTGSYSAISKELKLSHPSVVRIVNGLIEEKVLRFQAGVEKKDKYRRPLIELNFEEWLTIGMDIGGTKIYCAVVELSGEILFDKTVNRHGTKGEATFELAKEIAQEMLEQAKLTGKMICGIAIGVPSAVNLQSGEVLYAPSIDWRNFPIRERMEQFFQMPVVVENDLNLAALGELWYGCGEKYDNLVLMALGTGLGAGIILDGFIYRGVHEAAGEIGYMVLDQRQLSQKFPGFGALELIVAGTGLGISTRNALKGTLDDASLEGVTSHELFEAYARNEDWTYPIIENFVNKMAMAIIATVALLDTEVVVLSGGVFLSARVLLERIRERIEGKTPFPIDLQVSFLGAKAGVFGGAAALMRKALNLRVVHEMLN